MGFGAYLCELGIDRVLHKLFSPWVPQSDAEPQAQRVRDPRTSGADRCALRPSEKKKTRSHVECSVLSITPQDHSIAHRVPQRKSRSERLFPSIFLAVLIQLRLLIDLLVVGEFRIFSLEAVAADPLLVRLCGGVVPGLDTPYRDVRRFDALVIARFGGGGRCILMANGVMLAAPTEPIRITAGKNGCNRSPPGPPMRTLRA